MSNKEIEESLKRAAGKITPDVMDSVLKRIETENDAVVPMNMTSMRGRRSVWVGILAAAAAFLLVLNVGMFMHYHKPADAGVVELVPHTQTENGEQLIQQIVEMDPGFSPEKLASYSVDELDTILRATQARQEQPVIIEEPEAEPEIPQEPEELVKIEENSAETGLDPGDGLISDPDQDIVSTSGVSENTITEGPSDEDPQPLDREEETAAEEVLTEDGAFSAVLKDAGVAKEDVIHSVIDSVIHTSYGILYTIDFETEKFFYHYRITEYGTLLNAGRELKEDTETE